MRISAIALIPHRSNKSGLRRESAVAKLDQFVCRISGADDRGRCRNGVHEAWRWSFGNCSKYYLCTSSWTANKVWKFDSKLQYNILHHQVVKSSRNSTDNPPICQPYYNFGFNKLHQHRILLIESNKWKKSCLPDQFGLGRTITTSYKAFPCMEMSHPPLLASLWGK